MENLNSTTTPPQTLSTSMDNSCDTNVTTGTAPVLETVVDRATIQETEVTAVTLESVESETPALPMTDLKLQLTRRYVIANLTWDINQQMSEQLFSFDFPHILFQQPRILQLLSRYQYFRSNVKLEIRINANKFQYGSLILDYLPMAPAATTELKVGKSEYGQRMTDVFQSHSNPHVVISAQNNETATIVIPWTCPFEWLDLNTLLVPSDTAEVKFDDLTVAIARSCIGTANLRVLAPLSTVADNGFEKCYIQVIAHFEDPELNGPTLTTWTKAKTTSVVEYQALETRDLQPRLAAMKPNLLGGLFKIVQDPMGTLTGLGMGALKGALKGAFDFIGFSKPSVNNIVENRTLTLQNDLSSIVGQDYSSSLALMPDASVVNATEKFHPETTNIIELCQEEVFLGIANITPDMNAGTTVITLPVMPLISNLRDGVKRDPFRVTNTAGSVETLDAVNQRDIFAGWAAVYSEIFQTWRSDVTFRLHFYASQFHQARMLLTWTPSPAEVDPMTSGYGDILSKQVVIENGEADVEFKIPYCQAVPFLKTVAGHQLDPPFASLQGSWASNNVMVLMRYFGFCNGYFSVTVANTPVVMQTNNKAPIRMAVYMSFDNMTFEHYQALSDGIAGLTPTLGPGPKRVVEYQASGPELFVNYGDQATDLLSLTHRYTPIRVLADKVEGHPNINTAIVPSIPQMSHVLAYEFNARSVLGLETGAPLTQLQYLMLPYRFFRGGTRMRIVAQPFTQDLPTASLAIMTTPNNSPNTFDTNKLGIHMANGARWMYSKYYPSMELSLPNYNRFLYSYLWVNSASPGNGQSYGLGDNENPTTRIVSKYEADAPSNLSCMFATADDARVSGKCAPPYIRTYASYDSVTSYFTFPTVKALS